MAPLSSFFPSSCLDLVTLALLYSSRPRPRQLLPSRPPPPFHHKNEVHRSRHPPLFALAGASKLPVPDGVTVAEGSAKCGEQAQLSCCNNVKYGGDTTAVSQGVAAGLLNDLLGAGSAADGLGVFTGCSKLDISASIAVQDNINQQCRQNIACCAKSGGSADGDLVGTTLPCIALGSIL
ncbi:hypothetical protein BDW66DRAFT_148917 [Aspergillus desertorum]